MPKQPEPRLDTCWRKSRIAARILLREEQGRLTRRDVALGHKLAADKGLTPQLIQQAIYGLASDGFMPLAAGRLQANLGIWPNKFASLRIS